MHSNVLPPADLMPTQWDTATGLTVSCLLDLHVTGACIKHSCGRLAPGVLSCQFAMATTSNVHAPDTCVALEEV
eukprot:850864-Pelagomonas_calceolata.AAC.2